MNPRSSKNEEYFLIVFVGERIWNVMENEADRIFNDFWKSRIPNAYVIATAKVEGDVVVKLYTFFPFKEKSCGKVNSIVVNEYRNDGYVSELNIFVDKYRNMHICPMTVMIPASNQFIYIATNEKGYGQIRGAEAKILYYLAKAMKFKLQVKPVADDGLLKMFARKLVG